MNIGLVDIDGHNGFPNLALMKISSYHKNIGDNVSWATIDNYDITYISKIFTFSKDFEKGLANYGKIIKGGTGYNIQSVLPKEIDIMPPDYSIYPKFPYALGFLTRGCPNHCNWCIVPHKEGYIRAYADIEEFLQGRKEAILLDNNVLTHEHGLKQIEKIIKLGIKVDFNQGLDARIIAQNEDIAKLLSNVKWLNYIRLACDTKNQIPYVEKTIDLLVKHGIKNYKIFVYVLVKDINDAYERVIFLKNKGVIPFAQPYRDYEKNTQPTYEQKNFARWVNHKAIFNTIDFKDYNKHLKK